MEGEELRNAMEGRNLDSHGGEELMQPYGGEELRNTMEGRNLGSHGGEELRQLWRGGA
jgi:hypothetical protein